MRGVVLVVVAVIATGAGCGTTGESQPQSAPNDSTQAEIRVMDATSTSAPESTVRTTLRSETPTTRGPSETVEPTIYRPVPIREGDQVVAVLQPAEGVSLDESSVALKIVDLPDGRFLEADLTSAVVPDGAAFWTTEINGKLRERVTARQGSTLGIRVDRDVYGDSFTVTFSATAADGAILATSGDVQLTE